MMHKLMPAGMRHVFDVATRVSGLLDGSTAAAAAHHGLTTDQERVLVGSREVHPALAACHAFKNTEIAAGCLSLDTLHVG